MLASDYFAFSDNMLHKAVAAQHMDIIRYTVEDFYPNDLSENNPEKYLNEKDGLWRTALHIAIEQNNLSIVEYLIQKGCDAKSQKVCKDQRLYI